MEGGVTIGLRFGIYSLYDNENIGNRLQNYAVQYIWRQYGSAFNRQPLYTSMQTRLKHLLWRVSGRKMERWFPQKQYRIYHALDFNRHCLRFSRQTADFYVYGSDQIWNPYYAPDSLICPLTPKERNVAFCASFGITRIPELYESTFIQGLQRFTAISVREESGADLVERYTGTRPVVLCDPTMYVPVSHWLELAEKPSFPVSKPYVLSWFLGAETNNRTQQIQTFARASGEAVWDGKGVSLSPQNWLYLMNQASYVVTDSFHTAVFSILLQKPFSVMERLDAPSGMGTRTEHLLKLFGLERHLIHDGQPFCQDEGFEAAAHQLEIQRLRTDDFLTSVFTKDREL